MRLMNQVAALCLGAAVAQAQAYPIMAEAVTAQYEPAGSTESTGSIDPATPIQQVQYQPQADDVTSSGNVETRQEQMKTAANPRIVPSPVPEPVHYKLLLIGIALLLFFGHRSTTDNKPWRKN
jgi:hypothetical protein